MIILSHQVLGRVCTVIIAIAIGLCALFAGQSALAAIDAYEFDNEVDRLRYQSFIEEMRCPKCQNQNLAGSDSPIAFDLRRELYLMLQEGKSDKEIVDFMVARYGDYVLYRPQVKSNTLLLWGLPAGLLLLGFIVVVLTLKNRASKTGAEAVSAQEAVSPQESARLKALLEKAKDRRKS